MSLWVKNLVGVVHVAVLSWHLNWAAGTDLVSLSCPVSCRSPTGLPCSSHVASLGFLGAEWAQGKGLHDGQVAAKRDEAETACLLKILGLKVSERSNQNGDSVRANHRASPRDGKG